MKRTAAALAALVLTATAVLSAAPAQARDTGWDCRSCRVAR